MGYNNLEGERSDRLCGNDHWEGYGVRWLLGVARRMGKTPSSVVVYLDSKVLLGVEASVKMTGKRHSLVPYRWRA